MSTVSLTGQDTVIINDRIFNDLADGDAGMLDYPNELAVLKTGKNGNSIYAFNEMGKQCDLTIRVVRGSEDDKFLNNLHTQMQANFSGFVLMIGEFIKKVGDGLGNVSNDTYILSGGIFTKGIASKTNAEGDTEQSVSVYSIKFANAPRVVS